MFALLYKSVIAAAIIAVLNLQSVSSLVVNPSANTCAITNDLKAVIGDKMDVTNTWYHDGINHVVFDSNSFHVESALQMKFINNKMTFTQDVNFFSNQKAHYVYVKFNGDANSVMYYFIGNGECHMKYINQSIDSIYAYAI